MSGAGGVRAEADGVPEWGRRDAAWLGAIVCVAFAARLIVLQQARACPLFRHLIVDARQYSRWADTIVAGDWIGREVFYQAPLYPYVLALLKAFTGDSLWWIRVAQAALGSAACAVLFMAGRLLLSRGAGAAAGLVLALYAPAVFQDGLIQKTVLGTLLTCVLLWMAARAAVRPGAWRMAGAGAALGLLALTREETLLLAPALALWIAVFVPAPGVGRRVWMAGALGLGLALPLGAVAARNCAVGGEFVLTTSQAGTNFYIGNRAGANGTYQPLRPGRSDTSYERRDAVELAERAAGRRLTPSEVSRYWLSRAWGDIRRDPGAWARLMGRKAVLLVNAYEIPDAEDQYFYERYSPALRALSAVSHLGVLLPLAGAGAVLTAGRGRGLAVLYVMLATMCAGVLIFYVFGRYRFPIVPVLALLAGGGISLAPAAVRVRNVKRLCGAGAAALGLAAAANWPLIPRSDGLAASYCNAGAALADAGMNEEAMALYHESLALRPDQAEPWINLAMAQARAGRMDDAEASVMRAHALRPDDARVLFALGTLLVERGRPGEGVVHLEHAAALSPQDRDTNVNLVHVLELLGRWGRAAEVMRAWLDREPRDDDMRLRLAWLLATCPDGAVRDGAEAVRQAEGARAGGREDPAALDVLGAAYAAAGRYGDAAAAAERAVHAAEAIGDAGLAHDARSRLERYRAQRPAVD